VRCLLISLALAACSRQSKPPPAKPAPLTADVALQRIEGHYRGGMHACYRSALKRDANARGRIVVTFTVDDRGQLSFREAKGISPAIEACVERAMSKWTFPRPPEATTFRLAFQLSSSA
jgi:hypothetical protein